MEAGKNKNHLLKMEGSISKKSKNVSTVGVSMISMVRKGKVKKTGYKIAYRS